jgi:hypothetical protein
MVSLGVVLLASSLARANVPSAFSVQGVLRDSAGQLQSTMVNVSVNLFDAQTTGNRLAGPYGPTMVMATNGLFTFPITDANLQTELADAAQVWLELTVGTDVFARQLVSPQLYAVMCGTADVANSMPNVSDVSGNIGIGTTAPGAPLQLAHATAGPYPNQDLVIGNGAVNTGNNTQLMIYRSANTGGYVGLETYNSGMGGAALALNAINGGYVGIGTTTPSVPLAVTGIGTMSDSLTYAGYFSAAAAGTRVRLGVANTNTGAGSKSSSLLLGAATGGWEVGSDFPGNGTQDFYIQELEGGYPVRLYISPAGTVGIGTTKPSSRYVLDVENTGADGTHLAYLGVKTTSPFLGYGAAVEIDSTSINGGRAYLLTSSGNLGTTAGNFSIFDYNASADRLTITPAGNVGIGTDTPAYTLDVNGTIRGTNVAPSDARLKTNVRAIAHALDDVERLRGVRFDWKKDGKPSIGVIAQEVEKVYPELVSTATDGIKSVDYSKLAAVLIESTRELHAQNRTLQAENATLKARLDRIEARLNQRAAR